jgi:hypothetical protein
VSGSPYYLLQEFAARLGWHGLRQYQHRVPSEHCGSLPVGTVITYYTTTDEKFNLQINENPIGQARTYQATVVLERYGLRHIGWHDFAIEDHQSAADEAERLKPLLSRSVSRQQFLKLNSHSVFRRFVGRRTYRKLTSRNNLRPT